ncbi:NIPSNAP family protein [Luteolibacter marinus]|uniref:NIPSNAP family protein n=1 Tax=Luteolibacter marinus TaxID=2776705 RepID=UPI001865EB45|nr:NIPSNAP family protein [Luteolibacter marinus]
MIKSLLISVLAAGLALGSAAAAEPVADTQLYELRTYHAEPGKLDALLSRFRDHTCGLFAKHGMTQVGYWVPADNPDRLLIYLLAYPDRAARDASWAAFHADEDWKKAAAASEAGGKLVGKVDQLFLHPTDFSPGFPEASAGDGVHLFEMRTYTATPGKLPQLHKRFRDHTLGLFKKHGMTSGSYFKLDEGQPGAADTLLYFLEHRDAGAADESWKAFRADPVWVAAKAASEEAAGGSLTVPDGVKSVFLKPTDFSPLK